MSQRPLSREERALYDDLRAYWNRGRWHHTELVALARRLAAAGWRTTASREELCG